MPDNYLDARHLDTLQELGYVVSSSRERVNGYTSECNPGTTVGYVSVNAKLVSHTHILNKDCCFKPMSLCFHLVNRLSYDAILGFHTIKQQTQLLGVLAHQLGITGWGNPTSSNRNNTTMTGGGESAVAPLGSHDPTVCTTSTSTRQPSGLFHNGKVSSKKGLGITRSSLYRARDKSHRAVSRRQALLSVNALGIDQNTLDNLPRSINGSEKGKLKLFKLLQKYKKQFRRDLADNPANIEAMEICLKGDYIWGCRASQAPARLQSKEKAAEIIKQIEAMLKAGVIRLSRANAHSQVMLTPKKDNKWRFCIDYRRLNEGTKPEGWPLPRIKEMIQRLGQKRCGFFGTLDLTKGYYQAPLSEGSKHLTAFITPGGLYEWNRVAMGLRGAPSYFQKAMCTEVLNGLLYNICEIYLDDIIIFGKTEEEFHENLETVLKRLEEKNIYVNPDKCVLGTTEIEYVGHTISKDGVRFDQDKLHKVVEIDKPKRARELKSFLGLANYFREHVRDHSTLAQPLNEMLKAYDAKRTLKWTEEATIAFEALKAAVNNAPKLFFIDYESEIHLYTDASLIGIGAYLCQIKDGKEMPIAFYSRSLREDERAWGIPCLEAYAIWQAFKNFDYLLRDAKCHVHTDHKNLTYIKENGSEKVIRWKLDLMEYDFDLHVIKGSDNVIADYLSRNEAAAEHDYVIDNARKATHCLASMSVLPEEVVKSENASRRHFINTMGSGIAIPQECYDKILAVHNDVAGHHGLETTLHKLATAGHKWPRMREHVKKFIRDCDSCQKRSTEQFDVRAPHYSIGKYYPMESVSLDLVGPLKEDAKGNKYILVCIDSFTRFMWCKAIPDNQAETVADAYLDHLGIFGAPYEFKSDGGPEFANKVMDELMKMVGSNKVTTFAYNHQANGIVERGNKELCRWMEHMLYNQRIPLDNWEKAVPFAVRIHNASPVATIQYSPAELLYGSSLNLDKNVLLPRENRNEKELLSSWSKNRCALQDAMIKRAQEVQADSQAKRATPHPQQTTVFRNGDYVLVAYPESSVWKRKAPHKLAMSFKGPYKVLSHEGTVYTLQNMVTNQRTRKLLFHLRPYQYDKNRVDPAEMAYKDHQGEFYVEEVTSHTGDFKRLTSLRFVVKWIGYPIPEDGQLWKDLRNVKQCHDYLRKIGKEKYIPVMEEDSDTEDEESDSEMVIEEPEEVKPPTRRSKRKRQ